MIVGGEYAERQVSSNDHESYMDGSVTTRKGSQYEQVKGDGTH